MTQRKKAPRKSTNTAKYQKIAQSRYHSTTERMISQMENIKNENAIKRQLESMEEIKRAIIAHLALLTRDELKLIYLLIRKLARR